MSAICANRTAQLLGGTVANFWRLVLAAVLLAVWAHTVGSGLEGSALPYFLLSGCVGFGLGDLALFQALPRLGSRLTVLLVQCLAAPFAGVCEWLWLGVGLSGFQILCGATILVGVAIALSPGPSVNPGSRRMVSGILYSLLAAFGQGFGAVLSRKAFAVAESLGQSIDGPTAAYQRILGGLAVGGLFLWFVNRRQVRSWRGDNTDERSARLDNSGKQWRMAWPWIVFNSLSGPALGVSCYQWALKTTPTGVVLPIVATTPLVVIPFAHFFEGDPLRARSLIGGVIAVVGAVVLVAVS
ncbi:MAG: DMT family transporter [Candidatus Omnitrophica bacterium]|nr:DMT family transporter [Candidatus Omnitrophota bacterium]